MSLGRDRDQGRQAGPPEADPGPTAGPLEVVILRDGRVVFRTLTREMLDLALKLAPGDPRLAARRRRREAKE